MEWWVPFIVSGVITILLFIILKLASIYFYASITFATSVAAAVLLALHRFKVTECKYDPQTGDMIETIFSSLVVSNLIIFLFITVLRSNPRNKMCACCRRDKLFYSPGYFNDIEQIYETSNI